MVGLLMWLLGLVDVSTEVQEVKVDTRQEQQVIVQYNIEGEEYIVPTYKS
jgi:hypothetical protein